MIRYAQLANNIVIHVIESETDPDGINGEWIACGDAGPGFTYDGTNFIQPEVILPVNQTEFLIDLGPFYDRFGAVKMAVLTSNNVVVKAIVSDLTIRKWVDLKRVDVLEGLTYIASVIPTMTTELIDSILNTPVTIEENLALKKLYFS